MALRFPVLLMAFAFVGMSCGDDVGNGTPIYDAEAETAALEAALNALALAGFHTTVSEQSDAAYLASRELQINLSAVAEAMDDVALKPASLPNLIPACAGTVDLGDSTRINYPDENCPDFHGHISKDGNVYEIEMTISFDENPIFTVEESGSQNLTITDDSISGKLEFFQGDDNTDPQILEVTFTNVRRDNDACSNTVTGGTMLVEAPDDGGFSHILAVFGPACDMVQLFDQGHHEH